MNTELENMSDLIMIKINGHENLYWKKKNLH